MRILILSQFCFPEPDLKTFTFAKALVSKGHQVQILTGFPNYPGGKVYAGYKISLFQKERIEGIEILRCALYPSHDRSAFKRIINYVSFAFFATIIGVLKVNKADVMYVYHPPATIAIPAIAIKYLRRIPIVYDIQDMWPDTLEATGMVNSRTVLNIVAGYMKVCYKFFNHITVLSNGFRNLLLERGVDPEKVTTIYNWSNPIDIPDELDPEEKKRLYGDKFTILFAGTIGVLQGLDIVIKAAEQLKMKRIDDIQFALLGGGIDVKRLMKLTKDKDLTNILFLERVSNSEVGRFLSLADALLIHLIEDKLFEITVPSKTQAYLLAGKPILAGIKGDASELIKTANAGYTFKPEDSDDLVEKILLLKEHTDEELAIMGNNGKEYYREHLAINNGVRKFEQVFTSVSE